VTTPSPRKLGYLPDSKKPPSAKPDWDFALLRAKKKLGRALAPADNRNLVLDVLDQGPIGACVGNGVAQALRMSNVAHGVVGPKLCSRLWNYYCARAYIGATRVDAGCQIRDCFRALNKYGFLPEDRMPYIPDRFDHPPDPALYRWAFDQRDKSGPAAYYRILSEGGALLDDMRLALSAGLPVVFGTEVSEEFCSFEGFKIFDYPRPEEMAGGHCMTLVGHGLAGGDSTTFTAVGSWGERAHDRGFHHFSQDYAAQFQDVWVIANAPIVLAS
jgi:hypothetical protein